jgi:hypothetical protein
MAAFTLPVVTVSATTFEPLVASGEVIAVVVVELGVDGSVVVVVVVVDVVVEEGVALELVDALFVPGPRLQPARAAANATAAA